MAKNNKKTKWILNDTEITDIVLPDLAKFHFIVNDQMFQRLTKFAKDDLGVSICVAEILQKGVWALDKFFQQNPNWKIFQNLKSDDNENKQQVVMRKQNSRTKVRKHENHHVLIRIPHPIFVFLKQNHARVNTFSMAVLVRMIIEIFLDHFDKCGDYDKALESFAKVIAALFQPEKCEKCEACFKLFKEENADDQTDTRIVVFFEVNIISAALGLDYHLRVRL